uniref:Uncharacterized protein n=1 Tax=Oryzias sinensis TaxID=183150 RepID=A0A8C7WTI3_9TELE
MPRGKGHRKARARNFTPIDLGPTGHPNSGTGFRHPVRRWPMSAATGKSHKRLVPPESPGEKFVLVVGDSHLCALVDGIVRMPGGGGMTFGFMSTPGASAAELYKEVRHANIPRTPHLVCLLAPSNNLTASRTLPEAAMVIAEGGCNSRNCLFVLDFPPRLTMAPDLQTFLRQTSTEWRRRWYLSVNDTISLKSNLVGFSFAGKRKLQCVLCPHDNISVFSIPQAAPLPVSPVRFSPAILDLMDKFYPSDLDCAGAAAPVPAGNKVTVLS